MEELRNNIIEVINKSGLPLDCIYYIVKDIYRETLDTYNEALRKVKEEKVAEVESIDDKQEKGE